MKKRRHHYVWGFCLRSWALDEQIYCLRDGVIFKTNITGVANKRDFYRLKELSEKEIEFIKKIVIEPSPPSLQKEHLEWIESFGYVFKVREFIKNIGNDDAEIDRSIDEVINNSEEDLHAKIEGAAMKYIDSILNENIDFFLEEEGCMNFGHYLCVQYMRTKNIKSIFIKICSNVVGIKPENVWNVMSHLFAINMAWVLHVKKNDFRMVLLANQTETPFITGDQPAINTYAVNIPGGTKIDDVEFYYPVSPVLAILMTQKKQYRNTKKIYLNNETVNSYNNFIYKMSDEQIYSNSESSLKYFCE